MTWVAAEAICWRKHDEGTNASHCGGEPKYRTPRCCSLRQDSQSRGANRDRHVPAEVLRPAVAQPRVSEIIDGHRSVHELIPWATLRAGWQVHPNGMHADGSACWDGRCRRRSQPLEWLQHTDDKEWKAVGRYMPSNIRRHETPAGDRRTWSTIPGPTSLPPPPPAPVPSSPHASRRP